MRKYEHWVYVFAKVGDYGPCAPVKVGISGSTGARLATIQTACPFPLILFYEFECPNREWALMLEQSFHATQANACIFGEWFDYHPVQAVHLLCIGFRALADFHVCDEKLRQSGLDKAGVLHAEMRFSLSGVVRQ